MTTIWKLTPVGSLVASRSDVEAAGGWRRAPLPNSTLRVGDVNWAVTEDSAGHLVCWRRTVAGIPLVILNNSPQEEEMTKTTQDAAPQVPAKEPKTPKPIAYEPSGEIKAAKLGSKLAALIDALAAGATMDELVNVLSQTGSAVDASGVRSWISYDLKRTGLGVRQDGDRLHLVGTPLPHREATPKKAPEAKAAEPEAAPPALQIVPKKKAAGSAKPKSKKAKAAK